MPFQVGPRWISPMSSRISSCGTGMSEPTSTIVASGPTPPPRTQPGGRTILPHDAVVMDFGESSRATSRHDPDGGGDRAARTLEQPTRRSGGAAGRGRRRWPAGGRRSIGPHDVIDAAGSGRRFITDLHGIGLELHEPPYMVEGDRDRPRTRHDLLRGPGSTSRALRHPDRGIVR